ncbi:hypothetical protein H5410_011738 [Solanum commersonii]|uniref:No apical meristem-associated C-terminal domain-containing protein n=1 Tax=Solanum commersonii TaxID=4109 RepID=A0A9J6APE2_SOLCO|nr:hypothetical protein H5410_011738 [Solanum commersonii]
MQRRSCGDIAIKDHFILIMQAKCLLMQDPNYKKGFKFDLWKMMEDFQKFKDIDVGKKKVRNQGSFLYHQSNSTSSQRPSGVKKAKMKRKVDEDRELKDRALKLKEFKEENKIILMNVDGIVDPNVREFVRQEQSLIIEKRSQQFQQPQQFLTPYNSYFNSIDGSRKNVSNY